MKPSKRINNGVFYVDIQTREWYLEKLANATSDRKCELIVTPYASFLYWAERDELFAEALHHAYISIPDSISILASTQLLSKQYSEVFVIRILQVILYGVLLGGKILTGTLEKKGEFERMQGVTFTEEIIKKAAQEGWSIYILGGWEDSLIRFESEIRAKYPRLELTIDYDVSRVDVRTGQGRLVLQNAVERINSISPDVLFVALGPPLQEKWIYEHKYLVSVGVAIGVGATFDILSGKLRRAPEIMIKLGLEWFWRFITQPWRLKRILIAFLYFPLKIAWITIHTK